MKIALERGPDWLIQLMTQGDPDRERYAAAVIGAGAAATRIVIDYATDVPAKTRVWLIQQVPASDAERAHVVAGALTDYRDPQGALDDALEVLLAVPIDVAIAALDAAHADAIRHNSPTTWVERAFDRVRAPRE
jgi:hypothetical protein